ncbi:hypothetical protein [Methylocystis sp. ATCC 49242]|uniref:hypothetical protein n=1 Tax=Methylocystis sp. ATCC 49242 TaxID=622637 RepID=UPI00056BF288|nr:hypothetical protein [Methylocystis sp. ATCC 49242]
MADPIFAAIAEWERLEALHIEAINAADAIDDEDSAEFAAADHAQDVACSAVADHERRILDMRPQTVAGALALLRFIATIEQDYLGNEWKKGDAIRACADLIEAAP